MPEDKMEFFKPEAKTVEKIFRDADSYYQIPDYQRPYSWEDDQIEQLWDDIYSAMESGDESYFLGPLILIRRKNWFEVVDGQQRLTTLTILFCVLRDLYESKLKKVDETLTARIQDAIMSLGEKEPRLKLITHLNYQNKFVDEILNKVKFPDKELTYKEKKQEKFINAALIFRHKLEELKKNSGIESIKKFTNYLLKNVEIITITCLKQEYAIKLFQVLNTRGLDLSPADMIKSHLYGNLKGDKEKQLFIANWQDIETISKDMDETITDLFTYYEYYLLAQNPKRSLYEELTDKFKGQNSNKIIYDFKKFVEFFKKINNLESKLIFSFRYLPNQVFWKAILTAAKMENFDKFDELCKELRKMYYYYWIAGYTTTKIKQLSFNIIASLKNSKKIKDIKQKIEKKMTEDNVIRRARENLQNDVYGEPWLRPLLVLVEYAQTDDAKISFIELDNKLHVDHILPQGWKSISEWKKNWTEQQAEKWLNKLGNLTLLSGKKNIAIKNCPPVKKKKIYKEGFGGKTAFEISKKVIEILEKSEWTEKDVKERQKWMIKEIEKVLEI